MGFLNASRLTAIQQRVSKSITDGVDIYRNGTKASSGTVRVSDNRGRFRVQGGERYDTLREFIFTFPLGTDVAYADQLHALGAVYGVVLVLDPISIQTEVVALGYQLFDDNGNPTYIRPNATISTQRQSGPTMDTILDHITDVRIELPKTVLDKPWGPSEPGHAFFLPSRWNQLQRDDALIIHQVTGFEAGLLQQYDDIRIGGIHPIGGALPMIDAQWAGRES